MPKRKSATPRRRKSRPVKESKTEIVPQGPQDGSSSSSGDTALDFFSQENTSCAETLGKVDCALDCVPLSKDTVTPGTCTPPRPFREAQGGVEQKRADSKSSLKTCSNTYEEGPKDKTVKPRDPVSKGNIIEPASPLKTSRTHVSKPKLVFTDIYKRRTCLSDDGSKLEIGNMTMIGFCNFWTNGRFQTGRQYWEIKISVPIKSLRPVFFDIYVNKEGVERDGWYLRVGYHRGKIKCFDYCGGIIERGYHKWRPYNDPHHLGVLLNCEERTFAVLDPAENRLMFTLRDVEVSEPLVPIVRCGYLKHASVELITGDVVTLPQVLCEMSNAASE